MRFCWHRIWIPRCVWISLLWVWLSIFVLRIFRTPGLRRTVILLVPRSSRLLFAAVPSTLLPALVIPGSQEILSRRGRVPPAFTFSEMLIQPAPMSIEATVPEIPFSSVPVARAVALDAWFRFPAAIRAQSGAFPEGNAARTDRAFPLPNANRNQAKLL